VTAATDLARLRRELEARFGSAVVPLPGSGAGEARPGFLSGVAAIDALVPQGVPRGALSLWTGEAGSGRTAAVRCLVRAACDAGARVALVDATATLDAASWCSGGSTPAGLWVARPPGPRGAEGAWAAEALLRTGAFALVVLDGPPPGQTDVQRLRALARETDAALVVSSEREGAWRADLRLEFRRDPAAPPGLGVGARFRRRATVRMAKGWGVRTGERALELVHEPAHRLHPGPLEGDRRPRPHA
jgi:hypothetical protein